MPVLVAISIHGTRIHTTKGPQTTPFKERLMRPPLDPRASASMPALVSHAGSRLIDIPSLQHRSGASRLRKNQVGVV